MGLPGSVAAGDPRGRWPLDPQPRVEARFDPPDTDFGHGHRGVDLAGRPGAWVLAALPGTVTFAGVIAGRGVVVVDHGSTRTTYEPVASVVAVGDLVPEGGVLGLLELSGSHCLPGACLHWGWIRGSTYLDPLRLVGASGQVRLWPWEQSATSGSVSTPARRPWIGWTSPVARWAQALGCACW